jgi:hypothetical protein
MIDLVIGRLTRGAGRACSRFEISMRVWPRPLRSTKPDIVTRASTIAPRCPVLTGDVMSSSTASRKEGNDARVPAVAGNRIRPQTIARERTRAGHQAVATARAIAGGCFRAIFAL